MSAPINFPSSIYVSSLRIIPRTSASRTESPFTFSEKIYSWPGQGWGISGSLPPLTQEQAAEYRSFLLKLNGIEGTFLFPVFEAAPRGVASGTPLVNAGSQTGNTLNLKGFTPNITGIMKAGDFINLGTGSTTRLYQVLNDANSDGSGNAILTIWPSLRSSPLDNDPVVVQNCKLLARMISDVPYNIDINKLYSIDFEAFEAL